MSRIWQTIRSYIWWTHERGSLHYDVMVTVILIFIFAGPYFINFKDRPQGPPMHATGVTIQQLTQDEYSFQVDAASLKVPAGESPEKYLKSWIEPFLGEVRITEYKTIADPLGHATAYIVRVQKL